MPGPLLYAVFGEEAHASVHEVQHQSHRNAQLTVSCLGVTHEGFFPGSTISAPIRHGRQPRAREPAQSCSPSPGIAYSLPVQVVHSAPHFILDLVAALEDDPV